MVAADEEVPSPARKCALCGGELAFSTVLADEAEADAYNELLAHVRGEGLPEGHPNRAAWKYAESCDERGDFCPPLASVKRVGAGAEVCRICYRADVQGTIAAWQGRRRSDPLVLASLPRYWTLVVEAATSGGRAREAPPQKSRAFAVSKTEEQWRSELSDPEYKVLRGRCTEAAGTGEYDKFYPEGGYFACRACRNPLYSAMAKFNSGCGWPAFDKCFKGAVAIEEDNQFGRRRMEIMCNNCGCHLGHVFDGEQMTSTNERHCVNSVSVKFVNEPVPGDIGEETVA